MARGRSLVTSRSLVGVVLLCLAGAALGGAASLQPGPGSLRSGQPRDPGAYSAFEASYFSRVGSQAGSRNTTEASHSARIAAYATSYGIRPGLSRLIYDSARAERVNPALAFGLVNVESAFNPRAIGPTGSIGLTQLQPRTARGLAPNVSTSDLYTPRLNLTLGFRYLRSLLDRFDEDTGLALSAYNRGPERVAGMLARGRTPRGGYARKVLRDVEQRSLATL